MKIYYILRKTMIIILIGCIANSCNSVNNTSLPSQVKPTDTLLLQASKESTTNRPTKVDLTAASPTDKISLPPTVENLCPEDLNKPLKLPTDLEGKIVFLSNGKSGNDSYLLSTKTGEKIRLDKLNHLRLLNAAVSPDGRWLAYVVSNKIYEDDLLLISDQDGNVIKEFKIATSEAAWPIDIKKTTEQDYDSEELEQWINNDQLIITYGSYPGPEATTIILNPFTGNWKSYKSSYPDLFTTVKTSFYWNKFPVTRAVFNPSLDLVIYPSYDGIILWDLLTNHAITALKDDNFRATTDPVWAWDGSSFIIDLFSSRSNVSQYNNRNLYQVFKNGNMKQLTKFVGRYPGDYVDYVWSPDQNFVAFWLFEQSENQSKTNYQLAIINMQSHKLKIYCFSALLRLDQFPKFPPIWSPNSQYLVIAAKATGNNNQNDTILIKVSDNSAYELDIDDYPVEWMK